MPGVVESLRIITRPAAERIVRYAFELARTQGRRRVTFCHKADVHAAERRPVPATSPASVADDYPVHRVRGDARSTTLCMELALDPTRFDVLVMENLFGDVISDLCAGLVGGLGAGAGREHRQRATRCSRRSTAAPRTSPARAWPTRSPCIRSAAMMLEHIGQRDAAQRIERSVVRTLQEGKGLGPRGDGTTRTITERIIANLIELDATGDWRAWGRTGHGSASNTRLDMDPIGFVLDATKVTCLPAT